jgi:hypothetical protein
VHQETRLAPVVTFKIVRRATTRPLARIVSGPCDDTTSGDPRQRRKPSLVVVLAIPLKNHHLSRYKVKRPLRTRSIPLSTIPLKQDRDSTSPAFVPGQEVRSFAVPAAVPQLATERAPPGRSVRRVSRPLIFTDSPMSLRVGKIFQTSGSERPRPRTLQSSQATRFFEGVSRRKTTLTRTLSCDRPLLKDKSLTLYSPE